MSSKVFIALIRTHHMTSRKKITKLKQAWSANADNLHFILLRTGGFPGTMYIEGKREEDVQGWIDAVQRLRYKDYHLAARPSQISRSHDADVSLSTGFQETSSVKEFADQMENRGVHEWWRAAMGFVPDSTRL